MTYQPPPPYFPGPPPRRRGLLIGLLAAGGALFLCVLGAVVVGVAQQSGKPGTRATEAVAPLPEGTPAEEPVDVRTTSAPMTASDVRLTVKITKKDCFGSAGCLVEWQIKAAIGADPQECEITYEIHGLTDTQISTLDLHGDGTYEQDSFQSGETSGSAKKLTAKVTDVEC